MLGTFDGDTLVAGTGIGEDVVKGTLGDIPAEDGDVGRTFFYNLYYHLVRIVSKKRLTCMELMHSRILSIPDKSSCNLHQGLLHCEPV